MRFAVQPVLVGAVPLLHLHLPSPDLTLDLTEAADLKAQLGAAIRHALKLHDMLSDPEAQALLMAATKGDA